MKDSQAKQLGFTLIELMMAVAIIGIIAAFAYPSYQESVAKSRRADAQGALMGLASALERFYTQNNTYKGAGNGGDSNVAPLATVYPSEAPIDGSQKYYDLVIFSAATLSFDIRAKPKNGQSGDDCGTFTLTSAGVKDLVGNGGGKTKADCWR